MQHVHVTSLGCPKNLVDSEISLAHLAKYGITPTEDPYQAQILLVNTCGFLVSAREESIETILELIDIKEETNALLVVIGCLVENNLDELKQEIPEVDFWLGVNRYDELPQLLHLSSGQQPHLYQHTLIETVDQTRLHTSPKHYAYVKISEGCDCACSFCLIPSIRGPQRSRTIEAIVEEVVTLAKHGVQEVILIAQNLSAYGRDIYGKPSLDRLLQALDIPQTPAWIRCLYFYPVGLTDNILETIAQSSKILPYIDIPLQTISDHLLRSMKRGMGTDKTIELLTNIRHRIPHVAIRTSFIVGLPGESPDDFALLKDFIERQRFNHVGIFPFSPEPGTAAAQMPDQIPQNVIYERQKILMEKQAAISRSLLETTKGNRYTVLVDGLSEETDLLLASHHAGQCPKIDGLTYINDGTANIGDFVTVEITQTGDYDLVGHIVEET